MTLLAMDLSLTSTEEFHINMLIGYFLFGLIQIISIPFCLAIINEKSHKVQNLLISIMLFPLFYFLTIPLTFTSMYLFSHFDYAAYYYFAFSILLYILIRPKVIDYLRKEK